MLFYILRVWKLHPDWITTDSSEAKETMHDQTKKNFVINSWEGHFYMQPDPYAILRL